MAPNNLEAALDLASRGWPVFPLFEPKDGWCSCGDADCPTPCQHARNPKQGGLKAASVDTAQITRWWKPFPSAGIAIATGAVSGLWVLNVNPDEGAARLAAIEEEHGELPSTMEARTGGGGRHIYFRNTPSVKLPSDALGAGITVLADGFYVVAPPSMHMSGKAYEWRDGHGPGSTIAAIPNWIVEAEKLRLERLSREAHELVPVITGASASEFEDAVALYVQHNMMRKAPWLPFPTKPSACPICPGVDTFKAHPSDNTKWVCVSPQHNEGGKRNGAIWSGDVLDIDAAQRGRSRRKHIEIERYYGAVVRLDENARKHAARAAVVESSMNKVATVTHLLPTPAKDAELTNSFASLVAILSHDELAKPVLRGRKLEYDEFAHRHLFDRRPLTEEDVSELRLNIELAHRNAKNEGLCFGPEAIESAMKLVAKKNPYHPVRDYLDALQWDGVSRLEDVPKDILNAENSFINRMWFKRWMISAVARIYRPGCQAHHMLVLIHPRGGEGKSSFFRILASEPWFSDNPINISNDRAACHQMQGKWIIEWGEMEALSSAKTNDSVKAFIVRGTDKYLPPYSHFEVERPRQGVLGGTSNKVEFLRDAGGHRRFWPIRVGDRIELDAVARMRDQLWAEAVALFNAGEQWHPTEDERSSGEEIQSGHMTSDPLEPVIMEWLDEREETWVDAHGRQQSRTIPRTDETTVKDILEKCIRMPKAQWEKKHEMKIADILRANGWVSSRSRVEGRTDRPRVWHRFDPNA